MPESGDRKKPTSAIRGGSHLVREVGVKADRKIRAHRHRAPGLWFGLGMMGVVGWSVAVPTLTGALLGVYLDQNFNSEKHSWTLSLIVAGICIGCFNAWNWIHREIRNLDDDDQDQTIHTDDM